MPVLFVERQQGRKLSPIRIITKPGRMKPDFKPVPPYCASTYVSIEATCPDSCVFKNAGCYASSGFTQFHISRLNRQARGLTGDQVLLAEAEHIKASYKRGPIPQQGARGGIDLRLHVGGEVSSWKGVRYLVEAIKDWKQRGGGSVWTYTHRWREISRKTWGKQINVLASVENIVDAKKAFDRGYPPALVVSTFKSKKAYVEKGEKIIPCPAQVSAAEHPEDLEKHVTCVKCRLCLDRDLVKMRVIIGFESHGPDSHATAMSATQLKIDYGKNKVGLRVLP